MKRTMSVGINGISFTYPDGTRALAGVSLNIPGGEFLAIVGPSGCGKSTLLKLVAGLLRSTTGSVDLNGSHATDPDGSRVMVPQGRTLFPWLSVIKNVEFGLRSRGVSTSEARDRALQMIHNVGLADFQTRYPHQLSGGMQERAALAQALVVQPPILLLDEPLASLDWQSRQLLEDEVQRLWMIHRPTTILVTHDVDQAVYLADRVAVMTQRPGTVHRLVDVDLERPRAAGIKSTPAFLDFRDLIWRMLPGGRGAQES